MLVADVMTRDVKTCVASDSLDRSAHLMLAHDVGCVPVVDGEGRAIGLVTDRDLCMSTFISGRPLHESSVERTMTGVAHVCREEDKLEVAHAAMREHAVRRLVVVDGDGRLTGLLSLSDLVQSTPFVTSAPKRNKALEQLLGTLQVVTRPRDTDLAVRYAAVSAKPKRKRAAAKPSGRKVVRKVAGKVAAKATKRGGKTRKTAGR